MGRSIGDVCSSANRQKVSFHQFVNAAYGAQPFKYCLKSAGIANNCCSAKVGPVMAIMLAVFPMHKLQHVTWPASDSIVIPSTKVHTGSKLNMKNHLLRVGLACMFCRHEFAMYVISMKRPGTHRSCNMPHRLSHASLLNLSCRWIACYCRSFLLWRIVHRGRCRSWRTYDDTT